MRFSAWILVLSVCCLGVPANADILDFQANLDGSQEVPPTGSPATGFATITIDDVTFELSWDITWSGLIGGAETGLHFHNAPAGANGGVVVNIGAISGLISPSIGSTTIDQALTDEFLAGNIYINLHTNDFAGGEIRGQVFQIPEPASGLLLAGIFGVAAIRRRQ